MAEIVLHEPTAKKYLQTLADQYSDRPTADVLFEIIYKQKLCPKKLRNRLIVEKFDEQYRLNTKRNYGIYQDLAHLFNLSVDRIEYIVLNRRDWF